MRDAGLGKRRAVFLAAQFFQRVENGPENVGLVVGNLGVGKVGKIFRALNDAGDALETHAGVHVLGGQRREGAVGVGVELDEDEVPDLDAAGVAFVHELPLVSPAGVRSTCNSEHGPHGPVSPIIQKLSFCCR